jgi:hypothetical protein
MLILYSLQKLHVMKPCPDLGEEDDTERKDLINSLPSDFDV